MFHDPGVAFLKGNHGNNSEAPRRELREQWRDLPGDWSPWRQAAELHNGAGQPADAADLKAWACLDSGEAHARQQALIEQRDGRGGFSRLFFDRIPKAAHPHNFAPSGKQTFLGAKTIIQCSYRQEEDGQQTGPRLLEADMRIAFQAVNPEVER